MRFVIHSSALDITFPRNKWTGYCKRDHSAEWAVWTWHPTPNTELITARDYVFFLSQALQLIVLQAILYKPILHLITYKSRSKLGLLLFSLPGRNKARTNYSTVSKLFFIMPSPTIGNSGDSCHSPSTKNLISYLHNQRQQLKLSSEKSITRGERKCVPSWSEHKCGWEFHVRTSILGRQMLSLTPTIKCAHYLYTLMPSHIRGLLSVHIYFMVLSHISSIAVIND